MEPIAIPSHKNLLSIVLFMHVCYLCKASTISMCCIWIMKHVQNNINNKQIFNTTVLYWDDVLLIVVVTLYKEKYEWFQIFSISWKSSRW